MVHEVGVERVVARDQDREGVLPAAPGPADLLPQSRPGPGEAGQQHGVQPADVDPELEGVGGGEADQLAGAERRLDVAPLLGEVAAAVRRHPGRERGVDLTEKLGGGHRHLLRAAAGPDERQGADVLDHQVGKEVGRLRRRGPPDRRAVLAGPRREGGFPERQRDLTSGRLVSGDGQDVQTSEPPGGHCGIGHRGRREDERRVRAVQRADPAEAAQHVGDVGAEDPAVVVGLIDHDVLQRAQESGPSGVPGQQRPVQHVGVGQDVLAVVAGPVALLARTVAVVGREPYVDVEGEQARQLVVSQCLRGGQVEHSGPTFPACTAAFPDARECRQLIGEGLAGRRPGRQDDVVAGMRGVGGGGLVPPGTLDPASCVRRAEVVRHPCRPVREAGRAGREQF